MIISIAPIRFDTVWTLIILYTKKVRKWFSTKGFIPAASVGVNLKIPIHSKIRAAPKSEI